MPFMLRLRSLAVDPLGNCAGSAWAVAELVPQKIFKSSKSLAFARSLRWQQATATAAKLRPTVYLSRHSLNIGHKLLKEKRQ